MFSGDRRAFLGKLAACTAAACTGAAGCATTPIKPDGSPETVPVEELLRRGARVMWIAPHPDDELLVGALLARSSIFYGNPLYLLVLTHGEGGECCIPGGCHPDLGRLRGEEMKRAAALYGAELQHEWFFNAPLPVSSFPKRHELFAIWKRKQDPVRLTALAIRRFRPDLVLTFHPDWGATGHPEHQLASRLATTAVRLAASGESKLEGSSPHRVRRVYYALNRHWLMVLVGRADPGPVTESWDATLPCAHGASCLDFMIRGIQQHQSQRRDMDRVRRYRSAFETLDLCQVDPLKVRKDPAAR
jgi:LmbE family N-acetylglucosaminyl deacetylase